MKNQSEMVTTQGQGDLFAKRFRVCPIYTWRLGCGGSGLQVVEACWDLILSKH